MSVHQPVLLQEVMEALDVQPHDTVVDATLGGGGHTRAIVERLDKGGTFIGIDRDRAALQRVEDVLVDTKPTVHLVEDSFRKLDSILAHCGIDAIHALVVDLGLSSDQLGQSGRGFTFQKDEPLLMTFKEVPIEGDVTAREIVNEWEEGNIADILFGFGEERFARRIAKHIVEVRKESPIETTFQLVHVVEESVPRWYRARKLHPATKTFQAIRMAVNDEVGALRDVLEKGVAALTPGGRFAIITFHSVEDRIVKHFFLERVRADKGSLVHKKPITPSSDEISRNPRARSAKLRIFQKK